jgi:hypothetical protein
MDVMPDRTPLCCVVSERSHSATGNTKLMPAEICACTNVVKLLIYLLTKRLERSRCDEDAREHDESVVEFAETYKWAKCVCK